MSDYARCTLNVDAETIRHGFAVPIHIDTIKNVSKNDEGNYTSLRINFQTPGQLAGKKDETVCARPVSSYDVVAC